VTAGTELHTLWLAEELSKDYEIFIFIRTYDPSLEEYATGDEEFQNLKIRRVEFANRTGCIQPISTRTPESERSLQTISMRSS